MVLNYPQLADIWFFEAQNAPFPCISIFITTTLVQNNRTLPSKERPTCCTKSGRNNIDIIKAGTNQIKMGFTSASMTNY